MNPDIRTFAVAALVLFLAAGSALAGEDDQSRADCLRVGIAVRAGPHSNFTPLVYWGGFQTKTLSYEGLVGYGPKGELVPRLAAKWEISEDGRTYLIELRKDVTCHDGRPLDAETVRNHLMRWRGNFSNSWVGSTLRFDEIETVGDHRVRVTLHEPWPFLEECASGINPAFIVGKGAYTNEGVFARTMGTGPYAHVETSEDRNRFAFAAHRGWWGGTPGFERVEVMRLPDGHSESEKTLDLLREGVVDLIADGSSPLIPREGIEKQDGLTVFRAPGTAVTYLLLNTGSGVFSDLDARRRLAAAIDRAEFVERGELGYAVPSTTLFKGGRSGWPEASEPAAAETTKAGKEKVRIFFSREPNDRYRRHARILAAQATRAGFAPEIVILEDAAQADAAQAAGDWDITFGTTYGAPYDPWITLQTRFLDRPEGETASSGKPMWPDEVLRTALMAGFTSPRPGARAEAFLKIQARLDEQVPLIPLFISDRLAVSNAAVKSLVLDSDGYDLHLGVAIAGDIAKRQSLLATEAPADAPPPPEPPPTDPRDGEVPLPAMNGWNASLVLDNKGVGIWALKSCQVYPLLGSPEVVGVDDKGRCHVLTSYSGRWSDTPVIEDGAWFNAIEHGDIDPRIDGTELYVGGQMGNLYQVIGHRHRRLDFRLISFLRGYEVNILTAADFRPELPGREILVFTNPPAVVMVTPNGKDGTFETTDLGDIPGLVRETVVLPDPPGAPPRVACVSRAGWLRILTVTPHGLEWEEIYSDPMGLGRIAMRPAKEGDGVVLYTAHDDGRIQRHACGPDGTWKTELIYIGPLGPRGVAAGRFDDDPESETVAIFGYSREVELLTLKDGKWTAKTLFVEVGKGHSLATAELDGRNGTDEILLSGYGGRISLLARPPGYGRPGVAVK